MIYLPSMGVDPGVNGGLSVLDSSGAPAFCEPIYPKYTQKEDVELVRRAVTVLRRLGGNVAAVEKVGTMPTDGRKGANTFGRIDGLLRGALLYAGVRIVNAEPAYWQAKMECLTGGDKNISKNRAIALFPHVPFRITHNVADSLLIARYCQLATGME